MNKALAAAISTIEQQLEIVKEASGLSADVGEEHHEDEMPSMKTVGRGRKKRSVPTLGEEEEETHG